MIPPYSIIMKAKWNMLLVLFLTTVVGLSCGDEKSKGRSQNTRTKIETVEPEWTSIFNGKDLEGWTIKIKGYPLGENFGNTLRVEDSILKIR